MGYINLTHEKQQLDGLRPFSPAISKNIDDWFKIELTYLESPKFTRGELQSMITQDRTIKGKRLTAHLAASHYATALDTIQTLAQKKLSTLTIPTLFGLYTQIHGHSIEEEPDLAPLLVTFQAWITGPHEGHPIAIANEAHFRFRSVSGPMARLLMQLVLQHYGYPPALLRKNETLDGSKAEDEKVVLQAVHLGLERALKIAQDVSAPPLAKENFLRIGALAKATEYTVPTIRYWTKEGLLDIAAFTAAGYQLYHQAMIQRCKEIQALKDANWPLHAIKTKIQLL